MPTSQHVAQLVRSITENVNRVMVGKDVALERLLVAILSEGHVLLEDVPGLGKTMLARSLARSFDCSFRRIQFTPDLLPSDITGTFVFQQKTQEFVFRPGPLLSQIVLADEINRASPRTQSALLEAMQEGSVTVEGESHRLERPFLVIATQNPIELEGTFPLPEAQLDRFLLRLDLGYPEREEERRILRRFRSADPVETLKAVATGEDVRRAAALVREVFLHPVVEDYVLDLAATSREHPDLTVGASPRASLALARASQARAALRGREFVLPDDVQDLAGPVLEHRLVLSNDARLHGRTSGDVIEELIDSVPVPVEENWSTA